MSHLIAKTIFSAFLRGLIIALTVVVGLQGAIADERILSFAAKLELQSSGALDVTEYIEVRGEDDKIRRGIFRDIPTVQRNEIGGLQQLKLTVLNVKRDGQNTTWRTEAIGNAIRIYVGDANIYLGSGTFRYEIHYTMARQARIHPSSPDVAELYWNVTGNFWDFPIDRAVATVILPANAITDRIRGFTGYVGGTGSDVAITQGSPNEFVIAATRAFGPQEGMTVAVEFNADALDPISSLQRISYFLSDYRATLFPSLAALLVLLYYYFAWDSVGRDPKRGTIFPRFSPPKDFSPALTHYVAGMGWKRNGWTAFTAALVSLAVKGLIKFDDTGSKTKFVLLDHSPTSLPVGEALILKFIQKKNGVTVDENRGAEIQTTKGELLAAVQIENRKVYFNNNVVYTVFGIVLSVAILGVLAAIGAIGSVLFVLCLMIGFFSIFMVAIFGRLLSARMSSGSWLRWFIIPIILVNFVTFFYRMFDFVALSSISHIVPVVAAFSIVLLNVGFALILRAPTIHGRKIMDEIEGFKMYLETAEENRLNMDEEPELDPARFEQILPFAIALGVEKPWSERFQREFIDMQPASATTYQSNWYAGSNFNSGNLGSNISKTVAGVSAAMIASQPVSSSSSGFSGGGGSSGGGGGGGGGGGW